MDIHRVRRNAQAQSRQVEQSHPSWQSGVDARVVVLAKLSNVLTSAELAMTFCGCYLADSKWWQESYPTSPGAGIALHEFVQFVKIGFLHQVVGALDSTFRILLRCLDPVAANRGTAEFRAVYVALLTKNLPELAEGVPLLDLLRLTRNSSHNNGLIFTRDARDVVLEYRGIKYQFLQGKHIEFANWEFLTACAQDVVDLTVGVVTHSRLAGFEEIRDPGAD